MKSNWIRYTHDNDLTLGKKEMFVTKSSTGDPTRLYPRDVEPGLQHLTQGQFRLYIYYHKEHPEKYIKSIEVYHGAHSTEIHGETFDIETKFTKQQVFKHIERILILSQL